MNRRGLIDDQIRRIISDLFKEKGEIEVEINRLQRILDPIPDTSYIREVEVTVKPEKRHSSERKVTKEAVRDAVLSLYRKPPLPVQGIRVGFFSIKHVMGLIGITGGETRKKVRDHLDTMCDAGLLEAKPYHSGKQYRYVPAEGNGTSYTPPQGLPARDPVAHTGITGWTSDKDINAVLRNLPGTFTIRRTGGDHVRVTNNKNGKSVTISSTPSDHRTLANIKSDLRGIGAEV